MRVLQRILHGTLTIWTDFDGFTGVLGMRAVVDASRYAIAVDYKAFLTILNRPDGFKPAGTPGTSPSLPSPHPPTNPPKAQEERQYAIKSFKSGAKDVMVASGVASKGLDFNDIQHVIIFSMPKEIEDYVHQIGRTGRSGKTGIATTFVNMNTPEQTLLDLKYLLMEAGQK